MRRFSSKLSNGITLPTSNNLVVATALALMAATTAPAWAQDVADESRSTELQPIVLRSAATTDSKTDRISVTAKQSAGATKISTPLVETPRSVSVVTEKEIGQRGAQDVIEAVRYSAGVTTGPNGFDPRFDQIYIRGYNATTVGDYRDGLRQPYMNYGTFRTDPYQLQRVEVIKGPVSVLYGSGSPGGLINKISKLPTDEPTSARAET